MRERLSLQHRANIPEYIKLRPGVSIKGMYWEFHKGDNDYNPSVPHGHSLNGLYKLQLWSGNIYEIRSGKLKYKAKKKDMNALYNYPGFLDFVEECRKEYTVRNPAIVLPELSNRLFKKKRRKRTEKIVGRIIVYIKHNKA